MYRVTLTEEQQEELRRRCRDPKTLPRTRDRLEMVRLSNAGWSVPKIARHLGMSESRTRHWIKAFLSGGFDALPDQPHVGQTSSLTPAMGAAIRAEIGKGGRSWTAEQIADWLFDQFGVRLSVSWLRCRLRRERLSYQRTSRSLKHKQDPQAVAEKTAALAELEKRGTRARST